MQFKKMNRKMFFSFALILIMCLLFGLLSGVVQTQTPTKAQIAFTSNRDGNNEIYIMDADGKNPQNLTNHPAIDAFPSWFDPATLPVSSSGKYVTTWGWLKRSSLK